MTDTTERCTRCGLTAVQCAAGAPCFHPEADHKFTPAVPPTREEARGLLDDFTAYVAAHPTERFWQALRNWSGHDFVYVSDGVQVLERLDGAGCRDTFYWTTRNEEKP